MRYWTRMVSTEGLQREDRNRKKKTKPEKNGFIKTRRSRKTKQKPKQQHKLGCISIY